MGVGNPAADFAFASSFDILTGFSPVTAHGIFKGRVNSHFTLRKVINKIG